MCLMQKQSATNHNDSCSYTVPVPYGLETAGQLGYVQKGVKQHQRKWKRRHHAGVVYINSMYFVLINLAYLHTFLPAIKAN